MKDDAAFDGCPLTAEQTQNRQRRLGLAGELLDEPELGLHPAAISLLAALLESAAQRTQILVATQSVTLVNQFTPESVWVVERDDRHSVFKHLESADMSTWLDDYGLGGA